jgi:hypothetical protein
LAIDPKFPHLGPHRLAPQQGIHCASHIGMHRPTIACVHFHSERERGFSGPLQHCFLGAATAGLLVAQRHRLNSTHQVGKGGIFDQVGQLIAVGRGHQNHTPLSDGTGCLGLQFGTNLIDHDDFWHVVFHRLDHHLVL